MKTLILTTALIMSIQSNVFSQEKTENKAIREVIHEFSNASAQYNYKALDLILDNQFRLIMNQLFGSDQLNVMNKTVYLEKIKNKEFGGEERKVEILTVQINNNNATAHVKFVGATIRFSSYLQLVKNKNKEWRIINDLPTLY